MTKKNRILKISSISGVNFGDLMIGECLSYLLGSKFESIDSLDLSLQVYSHSGKQNDKTTVINYLKKNKIFFSVLKKIKRIIDVRRILKIAEDYPIILYGGGNMLFNKNGIDHLDKIELLVRKLNHKRNYVWAVGVGPFDNEYKKKLVNIHKGSVLVSVRDKLSKRYFDELNMDVIVTYDPAFIVSKVFPLPEKSDNKDYIGFNIMDLKKVQNNSAIDTLEIVKNIQAICFHFQKKPVIIISAYTNDPDIANEIKDASKELDIKIENLIDPRDLPKVYGKLLFLCSHRLHPSIFSFSYQIPFFVFPWQPKVNGVYQNIYGNEVESYLLNDPNFDKVEIIKKFEQQLAHDLNLKYKEVEEKIWESIDLIN